MDRINRLLTRLGKIAPSGAVDPYTQAIQNQLMRLRAVGQAAPPPPHEETTSALETVFNALDAPGRAVRVALAKLGFEEPQQWAEEGGLKGFLTRMITDPLTWFTLGIGGAAKSAATQAGKQLVLRAGVPFLTRTAEVAIPGTGRLVSAAEGLLKETVAPVAEKVIPKIIRPVTTARVPFTATPSEAATLRQTFRGITSVRHALSQAQQEAESQLLDVFRATKELPKEISEIVPFIIEDKSLRSILEYSDPRDIRFKTESWRQTISGYAKIINTKPEALNRHLISINDKISEIAKLVTAKREAISAGEVTKAEEFYKAAKKLKKAVITKINNLLSEVPAENRDEAASALKKLIKTSVTAQSEPSFRLALVSAATGGKESLLTKVVERLLTIAETDPERYATLLKQIDNTTQAVERLFADLQKLEREAGLEYDPLLDYFTHVWKDPQRKVEHVLNLIRRENARVRRALSTSATFAKQRKFDTLIQGMMYGLTPNLDIETVTAIRTLASARVRVLQKLKQQLINWSEKETMASAVRVVAKSRDAPAGWVKASTLVPNLRVGGGRKIYIHPELAHAIRQLDLKLGLRDDFPDWVAAITKLTTMFKVAVVSRPGQHIRNIIGNILHFSFADVPVWRTPNLVWKAYNVVFNVAPNNPGQTVTLGKISLPAAKWLGVFKRHGLLGFGGQLELTERSVEAIKGAVRERLFGPTGGPVKKTLKRGLKLSREVGDRVETSFKVGLFIDGLEQGMDVPSAAERARKYMFDYSDITKQEHFFRSTIIPFYVFTRKEIPLLLENVFTKPSVYLTVGHLAEALGRSAGLTDEDIPDWLRESFSFPVAVTQKKKDGKQTRTVTFVSIGLPTDILAQMGAGFIDKKTLKELLLASLNPLARIPLELAANEKFFAGTPIQSREYQTTQYGVPAVLDYIVSQIPTPFLSITGGGTAPLMGGMAELLGRESQEKAEPEYMPPRPDETAVRRILRLLSMSSFAVPVNPERQRVISRALYSKRLADYIGHLQKDRGLVVPTIDQLTGDPLLSLLRTLKELTGR